jgi:4-diphosphocytidyl-2-C-methyl-D-erythritol kinase
MNEINISANAKINITLDVLNKRDDGYHNVKMIMQSINLCDMINIKKTKEDMTLKTNYNFLPTDENNLAYKAAKIFFEETGINKEGVEIYIEKRIPVAAGLAGGSTDAASVLIALNKLFHTGLKFDQLTKIGEKLGSDVPFCMLGGTALAEGKGEILTPLRDIPETCIVLAKPPIHVSTAEVYGSLVLEKITGRPDTERVIDYINKQDINGIAKNMYNVLEAITANKFKIINKIKNIMIGNGAIGSIMSGSGPTVFGIFENEASAYKVVDKLKLVTPEVYKTKTCVRKLN